MLRKKRKYCRMCRRKTTHSYVGRESMFEGTGPMRVVAAIMTFGMTETSWADKFWECCECGHIKETD